jgi:glutamate carboxypeptidase
MRSRVLLILASALAVTASAQTLSPAEKAIVAYVDANQPAADAFLEKMVNINSGTHNLEGVRTVGKMLMPQLESLGFKVEWVPMDEVQRAGALVAEHPCPEPGKCGKRMLLIGHMDTVFEKDSPFQTYTVNGHIATGPGVNDMKGGLVDMLYALKALQATGVLGQMDITIVLSGDEEEHGEPAEISRRDMLAAARHSDVALEFEGTPRLDGVFYGSISRRSSISWTIEASGESGHSSAIFSDGKGYGAIYEVARILDTFRTQLPEQYLTFNVGLVLGGTTINVEKDGIAGSATGKDNVIPPVAHASGDIRTISNEQSDRVEKKMQALVAQHLPKTNATIKFGEGYPAMAPTAGSRALLGILNQVNSSLGLATMPELDPMKRGAGDIAFVSPPLPGLAGIGATGEGAHAPGETMDLLAQPINTKRAALLMYRLSRLDANANLDRAGKSLEEGNPVTSR